MNDVKFVGVLTNGWGEPVATVWRVVEPQRSSAVVLPDPDLKRLVGFGVSKNGSPFQVVWAKVESKKEGK